MPQAQSSNGNASGPGHDDDDVMVELRSTLESLAKVAERRATRLDVAARARMARNPWATVGIAAAAGAAAYLLVEPARQRSRMQRIGDRVGGYMPSMAAMPMLPDASRTRGRISDYAERAANAISSIDPQAFSSEALTRVRELANEAWNTVTSRAEDVTEEVTRNRS